MSKIIIYTSFFKKNNLLPFAFKYSFWALAKDGVLEVYDDGPITYESPIKKIPFQKVSQVLNKWLGGFGEILYRDDVSRKIVYKKNASLDNRTSGWSVGIVYSGNKSEIIQLKHCIDSVFDSLKMSGYNFEILVCGPVGGEDDISKGKNIRYVTYDDKNQLFFIGRKKLHLVKEMHYENIAVLHTRIILSDFSFKSIPDNFDVFSPKVVFRNKNRNFPYLDFNVTAGFEVGVFPKTMPLPIDYNRYDFLKLLKYGLPYIDGGLFFCKKSIYLKQPINLNLLWGEAEDVEWCARLYSNSVLVELLPELTAESSTYKLGMKSLYFPKKIIFFVRRIIRCMTIIRSWFS
ncbi:hypothetical protein [uncultured Endozoicomonas sp.]|uniref:hypothetical protein n=1 Tax=uncultured Endozoicomonas sp. TaxID=432652 RepID=UPI0026326D4D|nr:hypothetical protein [uncultured Endozoicomonas sp.]